MGGTNANGEQLLVALKRIVDVLRRAEVPYALAGGMATHARGGSVSDHDVDLLIRPDDADRALDAIDAAGFRTERPPEGWLVKAYDGPVLIDLIYSPVDRPVTEETLKDTDPLPVGPIIVPVLSASELLVHSVLTLRQHECDMSASLALVRAIREQIDVDHVWAQTRHSPYARAFLYLVHELDLLPAPVGVTWSGHD